MRPCDTVGETCQRRFSDGDGCERATTGKTDRGVRPLFSTGRTLFDQPVQSTLMTDAHAFSRDPDSERYGIPRVWRHRTAPELVGGYIAKTPYGQYRFHREVTWPQDDVTYQKQSILVESVSDAEALAERWMTRYTNKNLIRHVRRDPEA